MKYIESTPLPDGTYDHTEVREAYDEGSEIEFTSSGHGSWYRVSEDISCEYRPIWASELKYRAQVHDTYGIHESSSTLSEVKGDAGPAVAEMLLDRIKELEEALESIVDCCEEDSHSRDHHSRQYEIRGIAKRQLNKEPK